MSPAEWWQWCMVDLAGLNPLAVIFVGLPVFAVGVFPMALAWIWAGIPGPWWYELAVVALVLAACSYVVARSKRYVRTKAHQRTIMG